MNKIFFIFVLLVSLSLLWASIKKDQHRKGHDFQTISIECAASMKKPLEEIRNAYQGENDVFIKVNYGGSGKLLGQLKIVSRSDIFIAADVSYIEMAKDAGLINAQYSLANMSPVIAVAKGNPKGIKSVHDLINTDVRYAIADPEVAAIGKITKELLIKHQLWETIIKHVKVTKPTVNDLANDIQLGTIDAAIIWDAIAIQFGNMDIIRAPIFTDQTKTVSMAILKNSPNPTAALRFVEYLTTHEKGLSILSKHGFNSLTNPVLDNE